MFYLISKSIEGQILQTLNTARAQKQQQQLLGSPRQQQHEQKLGSTTQQLFGSTKQQQQQTNGSSKKQQVSVKQQQSQGVEQQKQQLDQGKQTVATDLKQSGPIEQDAQIGFKKHEQQPIGAFKFQHIVGAAKPLGSVKTAKPATQEEILVQQRRQHQLDQQLQLDHHKRLQQQKQQQQLLVQRTQTALQQHKLRLQQQQQQQKSDHKRPTPTAFKDLGATRLLDNPQAIGFKNVQTISFNNPQIQATTSTVAQNAPPPVAFNPLPPPPPQRVQAILPHPKLVSLQAKPKPPVVIGSPVRVNPPPPPALTFSSPSNGKIRPIRPHPKLVSLNSRNRFPFNLTNINNKAISTNGTVNKLTQQTASTAIETNQKESDKSKNAASPLPAPQQFLPPGYTTFRYFHLSVCPLFLQGVFTLSVFSLDLDTHFPRF